MLPGLHLPCAACNVSSWAPIIQAWAAGDAPRLTQGRRGLAYVEPDCAVITPTDPYPEASRAGGVTMINKRVMPFCVILLDANVACMMGAEAGGSGYYSAINPQLQVDLLNTTTMTFSAGARPLP